MVQLLGLIIVVCIALSFIECMGYKFKCGWKVIYIAIGCILIAYAGLRPVGFSRDSTVYEDAFSNYDKPKYILTLEFTFRYICQFVNWLGGNITWVFMIYAIAGISLKLCAIKRMSAFYMLPLVIYLGNYYIYHDLTQIRGGIASGIFLLTIPMLADGKKWKCAGLYLLSTCFHMSSLLFFPMLLLNNKELTRKGKYLLASLVPLGYLIYFTHINVLSFIPFVGKKIEIYQTLAEKGTGVEINVFGMVFLVKVAIFLFTLLMYDTIRPSNKYLPILLKVMGCSVFVFLLFTALPVLSFRISELYGIVDIIIYSCLFYTVKQRAVGTSIVGIVGLSLYAINVFYMNLLENV